MGSLPLRRKNTAGGTGPAGPTGPQGPAGVAGKQVEFQIASGKVQWRYIGETWFDLITLSALTGPQGPIGATGANGAPGANGREIELQTSATHLQWRYVGGTGWTNVIALSAITGPQGATGPQGLQGSQGPAGTAGANGREVEIQTNATHIQWRYSGETTWNNLISLSTITGPQGPQGVQGVAGANGTNGTNGTNGKQIEVQNNGTHLQWRYVGETWVNLIALSAITGPQGPQGIQGPQGPAGPADWNAIPNKPAFGTYAFRSSGLAELSSEPTFTYNSGGFSTFVTNDVTPANNAGGGFFNVASATASNRLAALWLDADGGNFAGSDYGVVEKLGNGGKLRIMNYNTSGIAFGTAATEYVNIDGSTGAATFSSSVSAQLFNANQTLNTSLAGTHTGIGTNAGSQFKFLNDYNTTGAFIGLAAENTGDAVFAVGANKKLVFGIGTNGNNRAAEILSNTIRLFPSPGDTTKYTDLKVKDNVVNSITFGEFYSGSAYSLPNVGVLELVVNGTTIYLPAATKLN